MIKYMRRILLPTALATFVLAGCNKGDSKALAEDSTLTRDLARVAADSAVQPELNDIPVDSQPTPVTSPKPVTPAPKPKPKPPAPKPTPAPVTTTPSNTTPSGNTVAPSSAGSEIGRAHV